MKKLFSFTTALLLCAAISYSATKPFKVLAYSAYRDGQSPGGVEPTKEQIKQDLQMLLPYTFGIRIYSLSGYTALIPAICDELGLELHVGVWLDNDDAENQKNMDDAIKILNEGHPSIKTVIVGNEYLLRQDVTFKNNLVTAEAKLVGYIGYVKSHMTTKLPVGTAEPYWWWIKTSRALWEASDIIYWQVHPWHDNQTIAGAVGFVTNLHNQVRTKITGFKLTDANKKDIISETGWPTAITKGVSVGSDANQQTYVQKLHAWAVPANVDYMFFCPFDEQWKQGEPNGVGPHWGIWNADRTPKGTITNLDQLIPANLRYTQGWGPVGIQKHYASPALNSAMKGEIQSFNVQGREVFQQTTTNEKAKKPAAGMYLNRVIEK